MHRENLLMVANSEHDADMLFAVGMFVPDPFIYLRVRGRCHIVMSDLEFNRARREAPHCRVLSYSAYATRVRKQGIQSVGFARIIRAVMREKRLKKIHVPAAFPLGLARELRNLKIKVKVLPGACFPERAIKTADEVKKISAALLMAEVGMSEGIQALKNSKIGRRGRLIYHHVPLTAEKLRGIIDTAILQVGGQANHTIVAAGKQACDPHEQGHGLLKANVPIIIDIFPRSQKTGYFGDITRTVVRGRASEPIRKLYHTVARSQEIALEKIRANVPAREVHHVVQNFFESQEYKTSRRNGHWEGFFHGTGHGLGLEIHETPRINSGSLEVLRSGHVVTVEPGLYYPSVGGVRIEDVVQINRKGCRNLSKFEKTFEL
jgi:Xaa-Pro aminopeptidase